MKKINLDDYMDMEPGRTVKIKKQKKKLQDDFNDVKSNTKKGNPKGGLYK